MLSTQGSTGFPGLVQAGQLSSRSASRLTDWRQSSLNAWNSLRMRGGLRSHWWRGLQLLFLTVISNALRHAEEIVLAAEVRAFRPEMSSKASIRVGVWDWGLVTLGVLSLIVVILVL